MNNIPRVSCIRLSSGIGFLAFWLLVLAWPAAGQTVIGTIPSPASTVWNDVEVYDHGNTIFIADSTNAQILIYNATTLGYVGSIPLSAYLPSTPQMMALHQGTGTLYVAVGRLSATADTTIVIIDADTQQVVSDITEIGESLSVTIDESRARLYLFGGLAPNKTLWALNVNTNGIVGALDISDIMGSGTILFTGQLALNPSSGELLFTNLHYDTFVVVDGLAMTGVQIAAANSQGRGGTWNPVENKIYITTADWNGYFIYDRDTGISTTTSGECITDASLTYYSQLTNRIYSRAEIEAETIVIEGATNACQAVPLAPALSDVGFLFATHHAYFAGAAQVKILDEDTLSVIGTIPGCEPDAYGATESQIVVSQALGRVFIRNYWSFPSEGSCILVIEEALHSTRKVDFNGDGREDILWRYCGGGGFVRAWFLGDSEGAPSLMAAADKPAPIRLADTKFSGDGRDGAASISRLEDAQKAPEFKSRRSALDGMKVRTKSMTSVNDPRKAGRRAMKPPPPAVADPRQMKLILNPESAVSELAAAPVLEGGADIMPVDDLNWQIAATGHFNDDADIDILWRNISTGANVVWFMNGTDWEGSVELIPVPDLTWQIVATGDFDQDTHADILWRNASNGANVVWYMDGTTWKGSAVLLGVSDQDWQIVGTGDFNKDGNIDILWRYYGSGGYNVVWYMDGASWSGSAELIPVADPAWQIAGTGDYDGDGYVDILWRYNGGGGYNVIWYMNGVAWGESAELLPVPDLTWRIVSR